jgi:hypothetical protein
MHGENRIKFELPCCLSDTYFLHFLIQKVVVAHDKVKGNFVRVHAMKAYRGSRPYLHSFLTSELDGG